MCAFDTENEKYRQKNNGIQLMQRNGFMFDLSFKLLPLGVQSMFPLFLELHIGHLFNGKIFTQYYGENIFIILGIEL